MTAGNNGDLLCAVSQRKADCARLTRRAADGRRSGVDGGGVKLLYDQLSNSERREAARQALDACENWLRKILHHKLNEAHGDKYFDANSENGNAVIPKKAKEKALARIQQQAFPRPIDAITFGDAIDLFLHPDHQLLFLECVKKAYPEGAAEARTFLGRLEILRNKVAHQGACSLRDLEKCVCYSHDLIDAIKEFFVASNMQRIYNVPMITRVVDNQGNETRPSIEGREHIAWILTGNPTGDLRVGTTLVVEIEVDESFEPSSYDISWRTSARDSELLGPKFSLKIENRHVSEAFNVYCSVISKRSWHRLPGGIDDSLIILYRVLPPPD
jgi:hypothetical protein